jgi:hypothetical protein
MVILSSLATVSVRMSSKSQQYVSMAWRLWCTPTSQVLSGKLGAIADRHFTIGSLQIDIVGRQAKIACQHLC